MTIDVSSLYTNISPQEGIEEVRKFLIHNQEKDKNVPTEYILRMLELVLEKKCFGI